MDSLEPLLPHVSLTQAQDESLRPQLHSHCLSTLREIAARNGWTLHLSGFDEEQIWAQVKFIVPVYTEQSTYP